MPSLVYRVSDVCEGRPNKRFKLFDGDLNFTMPSIDGILYKLN